jgi:glycosyltransferase involved in cell wall biosynthesis
MNVHFYATFSRDANNSPFAREIRNNNIEFEIFSEQIRLHYSRRIWLYFIGWPQMVLFAVKQSLRSLFSKSKPDWIVAQSHFDVLAVACLAFMLLRPKPKLMLLGFIYTKRQSKLTSNFKYWYFSIILRLADCVICHSPQEVEFNASHFKLPKSRFAYIPYGLHVELPETVFSGQAEPYAFSAGRSGRDYNLLIKVFSEIGYPLHIVCDSVDLINEKLLPENIKVFRQCYGANYLTELANAKLIVIPIAVEDISAGQMVLLQAMALQKPAIITATPITRLYVIENQTALLIEKGSAEQMKLAVEKLWTDESYAKQLSAAALKSYQENYSMAAYVRNICNIIKSG